MSAGKAVAGLVAIVVVLGAGLVVADRVAAGRAERVAERTVERELDVQGTPDVTVHGFPFLTQLVGGTLEQVTGSVSAATVGGLGVTDVRVDAREIALPRGGEQGTVGAATIVATVPVATLQQVVRDRTGLDLTLAVDGPAIRATASVLGLELSAALVPHVEGGRLLVDLEDVTLGGRTISVADLPRVARERVEDLEVPLEGLPQGVVPSAASVVAAGVQVTLTGTDVPFDALGG